MTLSLADFRNKREIYDGKFSTIYTAKCKKPNSDYTDCVLKQIKIGKSDLMSTIYNKSVNVKTQNGKIRNNLINLNNITNNHENDTFSNIRREIEYLKNLHKSSREGSQRIVKLYDWFLGNPRNEQDKSIYLVFEYTSFGDLYHYLRHQNPNEEEKNNILKQILEGIDFLHKNDIIHRDLKLANILVFQDSPFEIKIADLGLSIKSTNESSSHIIGGTIEYMHPDILQSKPYDKYIDYWSFGVIMYLLLTRTGDPNSMFNITEDIFFRKDRDEVIDLITRAPNINASGKFLLYHLLDRSVKHFEHDDIIKHQFFRGITDSSAIAFKKPQVNYTQLYARRQKKNDYLKRSEDHSKQFYYGQSQTKQKLHMDESCESSSIYIKYYYCKYCGYLICSSCTPSHITTLKKVKNPTPNNKYNTNAKICRPCAIYLGYIAEQPSMGGSYKKKINNKKYKIYIGPKGGKYYFKKDKNNKKKKVYIK